MTAHGHHGERRRRVCCAIVTVSDTRTAETDGSGAKIRDLLAEAGHEPHGPVIVRDEPAKIREVVTTLLADARLEAVLLNGGTGLAPRDSTFEAVRGMLDKEIDGFGELSFQEIGSAAMLSRATAGIASGKLLVSMPGSTAAVELAMRKLILPELSHILHLLEGTR
jgi:molybdopterin adenylyltransferase